MSSTQWLATALAITWVTAGLVAAVVMRRSGYDLKLWLGLGILLGPFAVVVAADHLRHLPRRPAVAEDERRPGTLDLLAGIDGSAQSIAAVKTALDLFGDQVTSLTLATVIDYDTRGSLTGRRSQEKAYARLVEVADDLGFKPVHLKLLFGRPTTELEVFASETDVELMVLGARGHGMSEAVLGSVSSRLIGSSPVPVFAGPAKPRSDGRGNL